MSRVYPPFINTEMNSDFFLCTTRRARQAVIMLGNTANTVTRGITTHSPRFSKMRWPMSAFFRDITNETAPNTIQNSVHRMSLLCFNATLTCNGRPDSCSIHTSMPPWRGGTWSSLPRPMASTAQPVRRLSPPSRTHATTVPMARPNQYPHSILVTFSSGAPHVICGMYSSRTTRSRLHVTSCSLLWVTLSLTSLHSVTLRVRGI